MCLGSERLVPEVQEAIRLFDYIETIFNIDRTRTPPHSPHTERATPVDSIRVETVKLGSKAEIQHKKLSLGLAFAVLLLSLCSS